MPSVKTVGDVALAAGFALVAAGAIPLLGSDGPELLIVVGAALLAVWFMLKLVVAHRPGKRIQGKEVNITPPDSSSASLHGKVTNAEGDGWGTQVVVHLTGDSRDVRVPIAALEFPNRRERVLSALPRRFSHELPEGWENSLFPDAQKAWKAQQEMQKEYDKLWKEGQIGRMPRGGASD